ncbi:MAG: M23 family metallopeptidase [Eubacteriales bacterium]|nr:M23 family metallopeptidase [Eubacteriales bacterium]
MIWGRHKKKKRRLISFLIVGSAVPIASLTLIVVVIMLVGAMLTSILGIFNTGAPKNRRFGAMGGEIAPFFFFDYTINTGEYYSGGDYHGASDLGIQDGATLGTPIRAVFSGTVDIVHVWQGTEDRHSIDSYGNAVVIRTTPEDYSGFDQEGNPIKELVTDSGYDSFITTYAHMIEPSTFVEAGDHVLAGEVIGLVGSTGRSTGPHLHLEMRILPDSSVGATWGYTLQSYRLPVWDFVDPQPNTGDENEPFIPWPSEEEKAIGNLYRSGAINWVDLAEMASEISKRPKVQIDIPPSAGEGSIRDLIPERDREWFYDYAMRVVQLEAGPNWSQIGCQYLAETIANRVRDGQFYPTGNYKFITDGGQYNVNWRTAEINSLTIRPEVYRAVMEAFSGSIRYLPSDCYSFCDYNASAPAGRVYFDKLRPCAQFENVTFYR